MSYLNEAYPKVIENSSTKSAIIPENWREKLGCSAMIGSNLANALTMTPYGMIAYQRLCRAVTNYTPNLQINLLQNRIIDPNNNIAIDAKGLTYDNGDSIIINISTFNGNTINGKADRFKSWTPIEILNIVGFHEADHLVLDRDNSTLTTDGVEAVYCKLHKQIIGREFKARIQFSLLYPNLSTTKEVWLSNYAFYFEIMYRLLHPKNTEKEIENKFNRSRKSLKKKLKFENSKEFKDFISEIKASNNFENGYTILKKYYKIVLTELESRFKAFSENDDATIDYSVINQLSTIKSNLGDYLNDEKFTFIP
jgi:hypothetical protein